MKEQYGRCIYAWLWAVFILTETMAQDRAAFVLQRHWLCMPGNTDALWSVQLKRSANLGPGNLNPAKSSEWVVLTFSQQDSSSITEDLTPQIQGPGCWSSQVQTEMWQLCFPRLVPAEKGCPRRRAPYCCPLAQAHTHLPKQPEQHISVERALMCLVHDDSTVVVQVSLPQ